jgi:hypothetical protein
MQAKAQPLFIELESVFHFNSLKNNAGISAYIIQKYQDDI